MAVLSKLVSFAFALQILSIVAAVPAFSSDYAPQKGNCPGVPLVRAASGLSDEETNYVSQRKAVADAALTTWLQSVNPKFDNTSLPKLALTASGGGYRAMLCGAGVVQGFDARDSNVSTSGLYQAMTYHAGLSGGAWLVESIAGNNYPTVSALTDHWTPYLSGGIMTTIFSWSNPVLVNVIRDIIAKARAGFQIDFVDPWGRLLSQQLFFGADGNSATTLSSVTTLSNFTTFQAPFPIATCLGLDASAGECVAKPNSTQYEFTPFEFGSWDEGVAAFAQTKYLGTNLSNGQPTDPSQCVEGFDNIGTILGTSSNLFNSPGCGNVPSNATGIVGLMQKLLTAAKTEVVERAGFSNFVNPFYGFPSSSGVADSPFLNLVDGGEFDIIEHGQGDPLWPLIHNERGVDVIIINDASGDTADGYPNGNALRATLLQSQQQGLGNRMPDIPSADIITGEKKLNKRPTFFGCNNPDSVTLIWLPNQKYTFESGVSTYKFTYTAEETASMISNSVQVATHGGDEQWATCLACGLMKKESGNQALPDECTKCFSDYCYN